MVGDGKVTKVTGISRFWGGRLQKTLHGKKVRDEGCIQCGMRNWLESWRQGIENQEFSTEAL